MPYSEMMAMRLLWLFLAAVGLTGCQTANWADTTGKNRSEARVQSDYKVCASEAGIGIPDRNPTHDEREAYRQRLMVCMFSRGWRAANPWSL